ncbi:hypothetical protein ACFRKB_11325 [Streptomyces scopuliridis]|uniref:hypothetical protein n=1 Tax=Streptomyces scopuliridis TaxID=452529 RepID=UPI0036858131
MATRRRQAAHDSGEDLWNRVEAAGEPGLATDEAMGSNTRGQFEYGKGWIKDKKCKAEKKCWVYHHGMYSVTVDPDKSTMYASERMRSLYRQARRIYDCSIAPLPPAAQKLPTVKLLRSQCESIFAAMSVLEAAGFSAETAVKKETSAKKRASTSAVKTRTR